MSPSSSEALANAKVTNATACDAHTAFTSGPAITPGTSGTKSSETVNVQIRGINTKQLQLDKCTDEANAPTPTSSFNKNDTGKGEAALAPS